MQRKNRLPKISIVMPSLNSVDYIERSIRSVVEQDYSNLELFIKDGGSKDGSLEIIKYYAQKYPVIIKWVSSKDLGQADAINYGMKNITGEIVAYLNSDDVYKKRALKVVGEFFYNHPQTIWIYGKCDIIDGEDKPIRGWITTYKNIWMKGFSLKTLLILNYISQMGVFFKKTAFKEIGLFDKNLHYVMDYDYWIRLGKKYRPAILNDYLASFRIVPTTKSSTGFIKQFEEDLGVAKKHTQSRLILYLHQIHNTLIIAIYSVIKYLTSKRVPNDE